MDRAGVGHEQRSGLGGNERLRQFSQRGRARG
jgi:hypothetical protein